MDSYSMTLPESTIQPMRCVKCGLEMQGAIYIDGTGPYCPTCKPQTIAPAVAGWQCPSCGVIHAPWVAQCWCSVSIMYTDGTKDKS